MIKPLLFAIALFAAVPHARAQVTWGDTVTVVERDAGWGRMTKLPDGRWLAVTTRFHENAPTTLTLSVSDDRARTWKPWSEVAEPGRKIDNGEVFLSLIHI